MPDPERGRDAPGPAVLAVCGKGGVGKTTVSAMLTKILMENAAHRILAIDADPAVGLATALGLPVRKTVDDIRKEIVADIQSGHPVDRQDMIHRLDYDLTAALAEDRNLAFLAVGRPEDAGCYCQVNHLLKDIIAGLAGHFDYVVIDGEAGIEQVNRRVMTAVTHLLLVSDTSLKGLRVCRTIKKVAATTMACRRDGLIINRVRPEDPPPAPEALSDLQLIGTLPESDRVRRFDMTGQSLLTLPEGPPLPSLRQCLREGLELPFGGPPGLSSAR